jgi:hypothetical protein
VQTGLAIDIEYDQNIYGFTDRLLFPILICIANYCYGEAKNNAWIGEYVLFVFYNQCNTNLRNGHLDLRSDSRR